MALLDPSVTDLSISRQRIWTSTLKKNGYLKPVIRDTGWDLVEYENIGSGLEPGTNNFEQRGDGKISDKRYTGILFIEDTDTLAKFATSTGGPIPRNTPS